MEGWLPSGCVGGIMLVAGCFPHLQCSSVTKLFKTYKAHVAWQHNEIATECTRWVGITILTMCKQVNK